MEHKSFQNIHIVLVEPQSSGNIGSVARAMKNTGFKNLILINPADYKNDKAYKMACKADDVLLGAKVFTKLSNAIKDSSLVIGTTRRKGRMRYPVMTFYDVLPQIVKTSKKNKVSVIFGREDKGLSNEELKLCSNIVEIPTNKNYPSLNLSHAVFLVCYEIFRATPSPFPLPAWERVRGQSITLATMDEINDMYIHLEKTLQKLDYGEKGGTHLLDAIMRGFKRLFGRTGLMQKEVNMLRGICAQIEKRTVS
ncbi:MAG: RNA methyltransferase [Deltaproteobacteria bacterium]|nr:RNA methyltransferase [Deltaproteobacteria bacterium]